jgi:hypothetical protein
VGYLHDLSGLRIGRLTVIGRAPNGKSRETRWNVRCDCGTVKAVGAPKLVAATTTSCGCLARELSSQRRRGKALTRTHGMTDTPTYSTWCAMKTRCTNANFPGYELYGARGITVCARWLNFENFLADMGERPPRLTIDRIDPNGNYEPGNCRWATPSQQRRNQRRTRLTLDAVNEILGRLEHGESPGSVGRRFGLSTGSICQIRAGLSWVEGVVPYQHQHR